MKLNLQNLKNKFKTDKFEHGYIKYYQEHLPDIIDDLLEIGCHKGESLRLWRHIYPKAKISTIDLFGNPNAISYEDILKEGFIAYKGDQSDPELLFSIADQFDIIIDDGSHNSDHQIISFKHLFENNLKPGGIYVIEDLHCCKESFYWGSGINKEEDTFLFIAQYRFNIKRFPVTLLFNAEEVTLFNDLVKEIYLYDDKITFIKKRES